MGSQLDKDQKDSLLNEYREISNNFRVLTDIRFKLLGALPLATAAASAALWQKDTPREFTVALSLFGLAVTTGLAVYNTRNDQLYDELIGRAAEIERQLGFPGGAFANRPQAWLTITLLGIKARIDHRTGVGIIYATCVVLWLFGIYAPIMEGAGCFYLHWSERLSPIYHARIWVRGLATLFALLSTYLAVKTITKQRQNRQRRMRELVVKVVNDLFTLELRRAADDSRFIERCAELAGIDTSTVQARAKYYANLQEAELTNYMPLEPPRIKMAHFVALLTDLSPRWIDDCVTNRRGAVKTK